MGTILEWSNVSYGVRSGFWLKKKTLVDGVSFSLPEGAILGLIGPNGAGKTTTLKLGAGILTPDQGQVLYKDHPTFHPQHLSNTGFLPEFQYTYPHITLKEWFIFLGSLSGYPKKKLDENLKQYAEMLSIGQLLNRQIRTLSKGQVQRAGIVQAFLHNPDILLLDEPMSGLDPYWRFRVHQLLREFNNKGGTILFSSHILSDVERLCDRIVLIQNGKVQWQGALSELQGQVKEYQVVFKGSSKEVLRPWIPQGRGEILPSGNLLFSVSPDQKDALLGFVTAKKLDLISMTPNYEDLAKLLFELKPMGSA